MSQDVDFLLAIPILEPETTDGFTKPSPVAGVIYIDSTRPAYHLDDGGLRELVSMCSALVSSLETASRLDGISNIISSGIGGSVPDAEGLDEGAAETLEIVVEVDPPRFSRAFQFNFDYADFVPIQS
jgi:hypothetical protein